MVATLSIFLTGAFLEPFDEFYSTIEPKNWKLCKVMLIRRMKDDLWERVAVGILHEKLWSEGLPHQQWIHLS